MTKGVRFPFKFFYINRKMKKITKLIKIAIMKTWISTQLYVCSEWCWVVPHYSYYSLLRRWRETIRFCASAVSISLMYTSSPSLRSRWYTRHYCNELDSMRSMLATHLGQPRDLPAYNEDAVVSRKTLCLFPSFCIKKRVSPWTENDIAHHADESEVNITNTVRA